MKVIKDELLNSCYLQSNISVFQQESHITVAWAEFVRSGPAGYKDTARAEV